MVWALLFSEYGKETVWESDAEVYLGEYVLQLTHRPPNGAVYVADEDVFGAGHPVRLPTPVADGFRAVGVPVSDDGILRVKDGGMALHLKEILGDIPTLTLTGVAEGFPFPPNHSPKSPMGYIGGEDGVLVVAYDGSPLQSGLGWFVFRDGDVSYRIIAVVAPPAPPYTLDLDKGYLWDGSRWWAVSILPC